MFVLPYPKRNQTRELASSVGKELNLGTEMQLESALPELSKKVTCAPNTDALISLAEPSSVNSCRQLGQLPCDSVINLSHLYPGLERGRFLVYPILIMLPASQSSLDVLPKLLEEVSKET